MQEHGLACQLKPCYTGDMNDRIQPAAGDLFEGTGTFHVLVRVLSVENDSARVMLVRSGIQKHIRLATLLSEAYRRVPTKPIRMKEKT